MKKILIDTNAYSRFLSGDDKILNVLSKAEVVYMSVFVLGELYAGFKGGIREQENKSLLKRFLRKPTVSLLDANDETAQLFGMIKDTLKRAGRPLPINDIWIASHSLQTDSVLVTYDSHFKKIPGIRLWDW